jgi:hypothetical protein
MGSFRHLIKSAALVCVVLPAFSYTLMAAPQILAVSSSNIDVRMHCFDGLCSAELSSVCLQEDRSSPYAMTEYYIHGNKNLLLTAHYSDGRRKTLSDLPLTIVSARGHNAVRVGFRKNLLKADRPMFVSISVPENITVVPMPVAADDNPQTDTDISLASGSFRLVATGIVDRNTKNRATAELINQAINALPVRGRAEPAIRDNAKEYSTAIAKMSAFRKDVRERAVRVVDYCHTNTTAGLQNYRQCLGSWHDMLIGELNTKFWDAIKTGS